MTTAVENILLAATEVAIEASDGGAKRPQISIIAYSGGVMRVYHDFGAAFVDPRAGVRSKGEA